ncbi:hypothetical protein [Sphingobium yanoikuyae]|uniref:hypothetical protein n=1 Tax=Sphingobium yanoikuyae TaxID=13690 RepID=UPI00345E8B5C
MQFIVRWVGGAIEKVTGGRRWKACAPPPTSSIGQSESPLVIRPYLAASTGRSCSR